MENIKKLLQARVNRVIEVVETLQDKGFNLTYNLQENEIVVEVKTPRFYLNIIPHIELEDRYMVTLRDSVKNDSGVRCLYEYELVNHLIAE